MKSQNTKDADDMMQAILKIQKTELICKN